MLILVIIIVILVIMVTLVIIIERHLELEETTLGVYVGNCDHDVINLGVSGDSGDHLKLEETTLGVHVLKNTSAGHQCFSSVS